MTSRNMSLGSVLAMLVSAAAVLVSSVQAVRTPPLAYASSLDTVYQLSAYTAPTLNGGSAGNITSTWSGTVDDTASGHKQSINGFGASITDATVTSFNALPKKQYNALLSDLFSPTAGIGMSLMRHTIGASDMSSYVYTYDDSPSPDPKLKSFNLTPAGRAMASLLSDMRSVNPAIKLLGSMWSPPGWMKLNGVSSGTTVNNNLNMSYAGEYAQYFVKYIQKFAAQGVPVDYITLQNEPLNSAAGFPTMYLSAQDATALIHDHVGPAFDAANISTQIWAYDHNTDVPSYPQTVLDGARRYVNTVAWHCYATNANWATLSAFRANNTNTTGLTQYMTECWVSPLTAWYQSVEFTLQPLQNWASGTLGWTLGTTTTLGPHLPGGCITCRGIIEVDTSTGTYRKSMDYYFLGQFSRFVARGSTVLATTGSYEFGAGDGVELTAVVNADGSRTVVIFNGFGSLVYMTVTFASGEVWKGPLYQYSVTTWLLPPTTGTA